MWSAAILGLAVGLGLGFGLAYLVVLRDKRAQRLQEELDRHRAQFEAYQTQVDEHFVKTSELFQDMTERYRAVYEHLAQGAQSLCSDRLVASRLTVPQSGPLVEHRSEADREALEGNHHAGPEPAEPPPEPPGEPQPAETRPAPGAGSDSGSTEERRPATGPAEPSEPADGSETAEPPAHDRDPARAAEPPTQTPGEAPGETQGKAQGEAKDGPQGQTPRPSGG